jgi:hypothetical protein
MRVNRYTRGTFVDGIHGEDVEYHLLGENEEVVIEILFDGRMNFYHTTKTDISGIIRGLMLLQKALFLDKLGDIAEQQLMEP